MLSCASQNQQGLGQGIIGTTLWLSGNHMPSPDSRPPAPKQVQREVFIHELTTRNEVIGQGPIYDSIQSKLIKRVWTNDNGDFTVYLPAGNYSIFTKEDRGYFASSFESNNIGSISIQQGSMRTITIKINYAAVY